MSYEMLREIIAARSKSFLLLAVLVLLDISLLLFLSFWQVPELERTQNDWFAKRDAAARGLDRAVATRYQQGERDLGLFQKRLIDKKDFAGFLSEMFALSKGNSLTIRGITYKPTPVKETGLFSYGINFEVIGKYAGVKSFIADLARVPEIVTLDSLSLANNSPVEESVDLRVQLTVFLKTEGV